MNKRGDLPTVLLFFVSITLMGIALFSFISFNDRFATDSQGRDTMLNSIRFFEKYLIEESRIIGRESMQNGNSDLKEKFRELAEKRDLRIVETREYFDKIKNGDFSFKLEGDKYVLEIRDLSLKAESGSNSFERKLDIRLEFDSELSNKKDL